MHRAVALMFAMAPLRLLPRRDLARFMRLIYPCVPDPSMEHVVPQSMYLPHNASRDLHNILLIPCTLNSHRQDYAFGVRTSHRSWVQILNHDAWKNTKSRMYQPPPHHRGPIARKIKYFMSVYPQLYTRPIIDAQLLHEWDLCHAVTDEERFIDSVVAQVQGNHNPWVNP